MPAAGTRRWRPGPWRRNATEWRDRADRRGADSFPWSRAERYRRRRRGSESCRPARWRKAPRTAGQARATRAGGTRCAASWEGHLIGGAPGELNGVAGLKEGGAARQLRHGIFAAREAHQHLHAIAQEDGAGDHSGGAAIGRGVTGRGVTWSNFASGQQADGFGANAGAGDPVDGAQEAGDEARTGAQVDVLGRAHLLDAAFI